MIEIMVREIIKIHIGQIVEIEEYCSVVEYNMDRIIEMDQGIIRTIGVNLEEEICCQIKIIEVDAEVEVGLGIDSILIILEGMIESTVGLDQIQEPVPLVIE